MSDQCVAKSEWLGGSTVAKETKQGGKKGRGCTR
jgi:hypothetical protein